MAFKAMTKFGVSFRDMLKDVLTVDKNTGIVSGKLNQLQFDVFWRTLSILETGNGFTVEEQLSKQGKDELKAKQQAHLELSNFLAQVLSQISTVIKKKVSSVEEIQPLINTVTFLALSYRFGEGPTQPIWDALKNLQKQHASQGKPFAEVEEATKLLNKVLENTFQADSLIRVTSTILISSEEIKELENFLEYPALDPSKVHGGEHMKIWSRLKEVVYNVDNVDVLNRNIGEAVDLILKNMIVLSKTFKISPELSSIQLLGLLHMLSNFLQMWTKHDPLVLSRAYQAVENFYMWPKPSCDAAAEVLRHMKNDFRSPGYVLIAKFLHESRVPQMKFEMQDDDDYWSQPVFCFMDNASLESAKLFRLVKMRSQDQEKPKANDSGHSIVRGMSTYTQLHLILQLLSNNLHDVPRDQIIQVLTRLDQSRLADVFYTACVASYEGLTQDLSDAECAQYVSRRMHELWALMQSLVQPATTFSVTKESLIYPPVLQPIMCVAVLENLEKSGAPTRVAAPGTQVQYPLTTYGFQLQKLIQAHDQVRDPKDPAIIRVFLCGSDRLVHSVVSGYLSICHSNPQLLEGLEIKWYVIPTEPENSIAAFIAKHDAWYHRFVYQPFRLNIPLVPFLKVEVPTFEHENVGNASSAPFPSGAGGFYKELIESYAREANNSIDIAVHELLGFIDDGVSPQLAMPFMCRAEISIRSMALGRKKYEGDPRPVDEILIKEKMLRPPNVVMNILKASIKVEVDSITDPLETIIISNVPVARDKCFPSDPCKEGVELYARLNEAKKSKNTQSEIRCSVTTVDVASINKSEKFYVSVDGEPYGPFTRVTYLLDETYRKRLKAGPLTPVEEPELPEGHSASSISVQTFFPINSCL